MPQLDGTIIGIIGTIVGTVIGVSATVIVFFLQRKKVLLQYRVATTPLITNKTAEIPGISIAINGQPVKNLLSTTISFINSGNQQIRFSDFSTQEPLRVILKGRLYRCDASRGNQELLPNATADEGKVLISFESLKPGKFFSVTILHDNTLEVLGVLTSGNLREYRFSMTLMYFAVILTLGATALLVDYLCNGPFITLIGYPIASILFFALCITSVLILIVDSFRDRKAKNF